MATCPARFEFWCSEAPEKLKFVHQIPRSLVEGPQNPDYAQNFISAVQSIMLEHYDVCVAASSRQCAKCNAPTQKVLQTPMSWLHIQQDPFVTVWVNAVCGKDGCETKTRQDIQDYMQILQSEASGQGPSMAYRSIRDGAMCVSPKTETLPCRICGKTEKTLKCGRCGTVAYCGKEHQKDDWKTHKKACIART